MRIALCGYEGEHDMPASWACVPWKSRGGYGSQQKDGLNKNPARERLWFSPHCNNARTLFDGLDDADAHPWPRRQHQQRPRRARGGGVTPVRIARQAGGAVRWVGYGKETTTAVREDPRAAAAPGVAQPRRAGRKSTQLAAASARPGCCPHGRNQRGWLGRRLPAERGEWRPD